MAEQVPSRSAGIILPWAPILQSNQMEISCTCLRLFSSVAIPANPHNACNIHPILESKWRRNALNLVAVGGCKTRNSEMKTARGAGEVTWRSKYFLESFAGEIKLIFKWNCWKCGQNKDKNSISRHLPEGCKEIVLKTLSRFSWISDEPVNFSSQLKVRCCNCWRLLT